MRHYTLLFCFALTSALLLSPTAAKAGGVDLNIGVVLPFGGYAPPPVVVTPAPVIVAQPPVVVEPPPVVVYRQPIVIQPPQQVYYYGHYPPGLAKKHYKHNWKRHHHYDD